jgi:hypothetical protein
VDTQGRKDESRDSIVEATAASTAWKVGDETLSALGVLKGLEVVLVGGLRRRGTPWPKDAQKWARPTFKTRVWVWRSVMRRTALVVLWVAWAAAWAYGTPVTFTFDDGGLANGDGDIRLTLYMSTVYHSLVLVNGAEVHSGEGFGSDQYLWPRLQLLNPGNIRIYLVVPTTSVSFDGYIFTATNAADFTFTAYDAAVYDDRVFSKWKPQVSFVMCSASVRGYLRQFIGRME